MKEPREKQGDSTGLPSSHCFLRPAHEPDQCLRFPDDFREGSLARHALALLPSSPSSCSTVLTPRRRPSAAPPARAAAPEWPEPQPPALRLTDAVRPVHYALDLTLLPAEPTYSGTVTIELDVREPVRQVWLHAQELQVTQALVPAQAARWRPRPYRQRGPPGRAARRAARPWQAQLTLSFQGHVDRERSQGIYKVEEGGQPYLYTFFEPIDARRAFPCFDEPGFKVPWRLRFT